MCLTREAFFSVHIFGRTLTLVFNPVLTLDTRPGPSEIVNLIYVKMRIIAQKVRKIYICDARSVVYTVYECR